jgi:Flp pilus assembly protein TadG
MRGLIPGLRARLRARAGVRRRDESGSVAFIVVMWSVVVIALAGLVIDGSLMISQKERAADLAAQAARAQAENVDLNLLRTTGNVEIELSPAPTPCALAQNYLNQISLPNGEQASLDTNATEVDTNGSGCVLVPTPTADNPDENSVEVCVAVTYSTVLIDLNPVATACATAHATGSEQ